MFKNTKKIIEKSKTLSDTRVLGLLAFGVIALLVTWSGVKVVQTNYELDKKISIAKQRNAISKLENDNLRLKNTYYETNQFLELASRRQFGKALPGEKLFIVPKEVALAKTVDMPATQIEASGEVDPKSLPKYQQNLNAWSKFLFR